jgi:GNAT superfamily N-acetyltransferase
MIKEMSKAEYSKAYGFIRQDNARNYFMRLGFETDKPVYESIIGELSDKGELKAILLKRLSGNLQFYAKGEFDVEGFSACISDMEYNSLISPRSYCDKFLENGLFSKYEEGAIIAKLDRRGIDQCEQYPEVEPLRLEDLDQVVELYKKIFSSFSSKEVMEKRLKSGRGRGLCIRHQEKVVSVVQSEFEESDSALIVGVGTAVDFQGKGLATKCLKAMCKQLAQEGKDLFLQYDNMDAGRIYENLGFKPIDQVRYYKR